MGELHRDEPEQIHSQRQLIHDQGHALDKQRNELTV
jgi:hypothetical protein